jgi:hypothetical protein
MKHPAFAALVSCLLVPGVLASCSGTISGSSDGPGASPRDSGVGVDAGDLEDSGSLDGPAADQLDSGVGVDAVELEDSATGDAVQEDSGLTQSDAACTCVDWETRNCEMNPTGNPVGGGAGYSSTIDRANATYIATTREELIAALASAQNGEIIYVDDDAIVTFGAADYGYTIRGGVTLAGGRGKPGVTGGKLVSDLDSSADNESYWPTFLKSTGPGVRITGLTTQQNTNANSEPVFHRGIFFWAAYDAEVDNNEINGWGYASVFVDNSGTGVSAVSYVYVHHNYIHYHDGTMQKDEYGTEVAEWYDNGSQVNILFEANRLDYNWHHIAARGTKGENYMARYNWVDHAVAHSFDCHGGSDRGDGTDIACGRIDIYGNTMLDTDWPAVLIRGIPYEGAYIHNNYMRQSGTTYPQVPIAQLNLRAASNTPPTDYNWEHMYISDNCYGASCSGSGCVAGNGLTCEDDCLGGTRQCATATSYQICGANKLDGCVGWMPAIPCPGGQTCSEGSCGLH